MFWHRYGKYYLYVISVIDEQIIVQSEEPILLADILKKIKLEIYGELPPVLADIIMDYNLDVYIFKVSTDGFCITFRSDKIIVKIWPVTLLHPQTFDVRLWLRGGTNKKNVYILDNDFKLASTDYVYWEFAREYMNDHEPSYYIPSFSYTYTDYEKITDEQTLSYICTHCNLDKDEYLVYKEKHNSSIFFIIINKNNNLRSVLHAINSILLLISNQREIEVITIDE